MSVKFVEGKCPSCIFKHIYIQTHKKERERGLKLLQNSLNSNNPGIFIRPTDPSSDPVIYHHARCCQDAYANDSVH